ncbi:MAG: DUF6504 family protein [Nocardioides sp.]|uniref:DUF6504 family protein n=1 Tax=Nocardioides sp. TaxID=35761 RepID=UPI003F0A68F0
MRQYDDPVEVRRGAGEDPEQFLWRGRLWKVRSVVAHWVETTPWWQAAGAVAQAGRPEAEGAVDLLAERETWRVEAGRGTRPEHGQWGVFDLSLDRHDGHWQLVGCAD